MEVYSIGNEQYKSRHFFFTNKSKALMIGLTIGIGILVGWLYYDYNRHSDSVIASSVAWQQINAALIEGNSQEQLNSVLNLIKINNNYGILASLGLARHYTNDSHYAAAERQLQKTIRKVREDNLKALINLRLAQLQLQQGNVNYALQTLDGIKQKGWIVLADNIRGDAQVIKGNHQAARAAYEKVLQSNPPQALQKLVCIKLNNLSIREGSHTIENNICGPVVRYFT